MKFRVSLDIDKQRGLNFSQNATVKQQPSRFENTLGVENYCVAYKKEKV